MKWSSFGRVVMALTSAVALGLSMTACGGGTIAYIWAVGHQVNGDGSQYNDVVGYQVDDFTGNLTSVPNQPYAANGTNPVDIVVRPGGGRFVYVINQGSGYTSTSNGTGDGIAVFAVGGSGSLTFEQSYETQGFGHLWATFDSTGTYLYVLDQYSPSGDGNGAITTFSSDPTTGRLNLVLQTASTQPGQLAPQYLEVGKSPLRMFSSGNCLFTANTANQTITTYSIASGQLGTVTTGTFPPGTTHMTSINGNGQYVFLTDDLGGGQPGYIYSYTVGSGCALTTFSGGKTANDPSVVNPTNTLISASGKYLYVLNGSSTNTSTVSRGSSITGYNLTTGTLTELAESPFGSGSGPVCAVEDPTSKYLYVANNTDGTITGYQYSDTSGEISGLQRGSTFTTATKGLTCLALSGSV
ncbi:MAG TPA: beta-propeller fold lactonase family protein [Acidobacteriaceae bacterium]|nr:beta-propeller fold lactonase family protein [Acidobacteriaceae bacterium]